MTTTTATRGLNVTVSYDSLGDIAEKQFTPVFQAELERSFPGVEIEIEYGINARVVWSDKFNGRDDELVAQCGESAFAKCCRGE